MTLDNMTGITKGSYTGFCKSQLITCKFAKACNGVCPFEDALKHADKTQTMDEQHTINHDREWIIGCIEHDGFIHTHRFDKANQIIHDALSAEAVQVVRCRECKWHRSGQNEVDTWSICIEPTLRAAHVQDDDYCSWGERKEATDDYH